LPQVVTSTSYNSANQQTGFGGQTLTYDNNGNLTSDGTNTYTWNARNQLVSTSGAGLTANFSYDAGGRRISKTINGGTTSYLYDGANIVQEQTGGSASANTLTGGVDMFFSRTDASGTVTPLRDALGSVVAQTDASGAIQTSYSYEPFGKTTTSGTTNSNTQKYTGREDDGTGLYYYRARYYSATLQRFISEDPVGVIGGINLYAYVGNNPISFTDAFGLKPGDPFASTPPWLSGKGRRIMFKGQPAIKWDGIVFDANGNFVGTTDGVDTDWGMQFAMAGAAYGAVRAGAGLIASELAEETATTVLYRAVSEAEFNELMETGVFQAGRNSLGGKFFAESLENASMWGEAFYGAGKFRLIQATVPTSVANTFLRWASLDNIGPARYAELEQLVNAVVRAVR
jgi:RHS repeat-associated protein